MGLVGVIIPVHNRPDQVIQTLEAIDKQTYKNFLCVVVDDASTDRTSQVVTSWISDRNDSRFEFIGRSVQAGPSMARNDGIRHLWDRVEYFAFCDSDDTWKPQKLERQFQEMGNFKISHTDETWIKDGSHHNPKKIHAKPEGRIFHQCLPLCCVSPSTVLIHKSLLEEVGLFDETLWVCEDYELWLRIFSRYEISLCKEPLVTKTGGHADQLSRRFIGMDRFRLYALLKTYRDSREYLSPEEQKALLDMITYKSGILSKGYAKHTGSASPYDKIHSDANEANLDKNLDLHLQALQHIHTVEITRSGPSNLNNVNQTTNR